MTLASTSRQRLELAAGEVHLGVPEQAVLGGERLAELGLEPVDLAAELEVVVHRAAEHPPRLLRLLVDRLQLGLCLAPRPLDLGLHRRDQRLGVAVGFERRLELRQLADQILQVLLVGVSLLQRAEPGGADFALPLRGHPSALLRGPELRGRLLRLGPQLLGPGLRFGLPHQLGEAF